MMDWKEFKDQYSDTFIPIVINGDTYPLHIRDIEGVGDDALAIYGMIYKRLTHKEVLIYTSFDGIPDPLYAKVDPIKYDKVLFEYPMLGMVNTNDSVYYFDREPRKQFKRGFRDTSVRGAFISNYEYDIMNRIFPELRSSEVLCPLFNRVYPSVKECIMSIRNGEVLARAFSRNFCMTIQRRSKYPYINYKGNNVGWVDEDNNAKLHPKAMHLIEELSEYLPCVALTNEEIKL